jgi:hypothetical protein
MMDALGLGDAKIRKSSDVRLFLRKSEYARSSGCNWRFTQDRSEHVNNLTEQRKSKAAYGHTGR